MYLFSGAVLLRAARCFSTLVSQLLFIIAITVIAAEVSASGIANDTVLDGPGGEAATGELALYGLIDLGLSKNPGVEAHRLAWGRLLQRYPQATALSDPLITYTEAIQEVETRLGPNRRSIMLSQKLPFPGKRSLKGEIARKEAEAARLIYVGSARDLVLEIKKAYYEIYYIDKATELSKERVKILTHLTRAEMNDYSVGTTGLSEAVSAETRLADAEYDLILFEELRRSIVGRMNALLSRATDEPVSAVEKPKVVSEVRALEELYQLAKGHDSVAVAGIATEKRSLEEELSGFAWKPEFIVGLKYTDIGEPEMGGISGGGRDGIAATVGLTIPLWGSKRTGPLLKRRP